MPSWNVDFDYSVDVKDPGILDLRIEIEANRRAISAICLPPAVHGRLNRLNIARASRGTSGVKGTDVTDEEVNAIIREEDRIEELKHQEIRNANDVRGLIETHYEETNSDIVTEDFLKRLHYETTKECDYSNNTPGEYRLHDVYTGDYGCPEYRQVPELMKKYIETMNSARLREDSLIRAIVGHFYLVSIHPFGDGNARTSRAVEAFLLHYGEYSVHSFYSLAHHYYHHPEDYARHLRDARFRYRANLTEFVRFSFRGVAGELESVRKEAEEYVTHLTFREFLGQLRESREINARMHDLLRHVMNRPDGAISKEDILKRRDEYVKALYKGMSRRTIWNDLQVMIGKAPRTTDSYPLLIESPDAKDLFRVNYDLMKRFVPGRLRAS
jgi:Fic family protein